MNKLQKIGIVLGAMAVIILAYTQVTRAVISEENPTVTPNIVRSYLFFASTTAPTNQATTTTATSTNITPFADSSGRIDNGYFVIAGAQEVTLFFDRKGTAGNAGSSRFSIQVTPDATSTPGNWYDYNMLQPIVVSSTANLYGTRQGTSTISAATTTNMFRMDAKGFYAIRCIVVEATDGEHTCSAEGVW